MGAQSKEKDKDTDNVPAVDRWRRSSRNIHNHVELCEHGSQAAVLMTSPIVSRTQDVAHKM